MKKQFLECGKIVSTQGILGEIKIQAWCDDPSELQSLEYIYLNEGEEPLKISKARAYKDMAIIKLVGVDTMEQAQNFRGKIVYLNRDDMHLEEGEHFIQDIIGLQVFDVDDGHLYGTISDVTETGANDVYHIDFPDGVTRLIPVIPQVIIETNIEENFIKIRPLLGAFDDED